MPIFIVVIVCVLYLPLYLLSCASSCRRHRRLLSSCSEKNADYCCIVDAVVVAPADVVAATVTVAAPLRV